MPILQTWPNPNVEGSIYLKNILGFHHHIVFLVSEVHELLDSQSYTVLLYDPLNMQT